MKKVIILILLLVFISQLTVMAVGEDDSAARNLKIDTNSIFENMDKAYKDGYEPVIKDNKVYITVPVVADGKIKNNRITAELNLGDTTNSPFSYQTYIKEVGLSDHTDSTGENISCYLIEFEVGLNKDRINGTYPVTVTFTGESTDEVVLSDSVQLFIKVTDGAKENSGLSEYKPKPQPIIMISSVELTPEHCNSGEDIGIEVTFRNTSRKRNIQNILITVETGNENIHLDNDVNSYYYEKLDREQELSLVLPVKTDLALPAGEYPVHISISYNDMEANSYQNSGVVYFTVEQPVKVEAIVQKLDGSVYSGDMIGIEMQLMNLSRCMIYNARFELDVPGLEATSVAFIGNMDAGTDAIANMNIFVRYLDTEVSDNRYGATTGRMILKYEDSSGKEYEIEYRMGTTILERPYKPEEKKEEQDNTNVWWLVIGGMSVLVIVMISLIIKKVRARKYD